MKKRDPKNKTGVTITITFDKELAESIQNFKARFKPDKFIIEGKEMEFTENDFWKQLLLLGAEKLQKDLKDFADREREEARIHASSQPNTNEIPRTVDENINP